MNAKTNGILHTTLVRDYVCAKCHGPLVERFIEDRYQVQCPKGCRPIKFIHHHAAEKQRAEQIAQYQEVVRNYPHLAPKNTTPQPAEDKFFGS